MQRTQEVFIMVMLTDIDYRGVDKSYRMVQGLDGENGKDGYEIYSKKSLGDNVSSSICL